MHSFENYFSFINDEIFKDNFTRDKEIVFNYMIRKTKDSKVFFNKIVKNENIYISEDITNLLLKNIKKDIDMFANLVLIEKIEHLESLDIDKINTNDIKEILNIMKECYTYLSI